VVLDGKSIPQKEKVEDEEGEGEGKGDREIFISKLLKDLSGQ